MNCTHCDEHAIWTSPGLCKEHFSDYFEEKVRRTIEDWGLLTPETRTCVAVSGGKDSLTLLHLLKKFGYEVEGLLVDEGIADYREHTITDARVFCDARNIALRIVSFKELAGKPLDDMLREKPELRPCTVCGTLRRHLLNKHAHKYDVLATGHNADDEAQAVLMNVLRAQTNLMTRSGPKTASTPAFVQRIKPLFFCTEKEIMTYALSNGFAGEFTECPNARVSYRARVRDVLNAYEAKYPGAKHRILSHHLRLQDDLPRNEPTMRVCVTCGAACAGETCASCKTLVVIN